MILSCYRTLLNLFLFIFVTLIQEVGAQPTLVKDINLLPPSSVPGSLVAVGNVGYFDAHNSVNGRELWRTDGTAAGTVLVKDIWPGSGSSLPYFLTNVNGVLYFTVDNGVHGAEVWRYLPSNFRS
jgi:ELWxxDGT repeat protein